MTRIAPDAADGLMPDLPGEADACPLCRSRRLHYAFSTASRRVVRCADCRLVLLNPQPAGAERGAGWEDAAGESAADEFAAGVDFSPDELPGSDRDRASLAAATARFQLRQLARYRGREGGALLVIDAGQEGLASEASARGFVVTRVRLRPGPGGPALGVGPPRPAGADARGRTLSCADLDSAGLPLGGFDACVLTGALEAAHDPLALLLSVRRLLNPDGALLVVSPSLDSLSARFLQADFAGRSPEARAGQGPGRLTGFDPNTMQSALHQAGFEQAIVQCARRRRDSRPIAGPRLSRVAARQFPGGGMLAMARPTAGRVVGADCRTLSVVVPAYNEAATVGPMLDALLRKRLPGMRIQVIVVESNSTDGTREVVARYGSHPRVRLVFEDRPRGKGHAVRTGLAHASGDYVLIQDADLEYDLEDYDALLEPLAAGREALVLGSRHGGNAWWKMRQFAGQPLASLALNCGHWFFTTLVNLLFRQRLRDPFTMYKVFRRDCLFGLDFQCDRFDFDYELLVKLIRKGYNPVEIPVNYRSRSFKEGKKISAFRDPFNWLRALAWLRFVRVDPLAEIESRRAGGTAGAGTAAPSVKAPSRAAA